MSPPGCTEVHPDLGVIQLVHNWSVACKIRPQLGNLYYVVLMFDEPLRISLADLMTRAFDQHLFTVGSRPS